MTTQIYQRLIVEGIKGLRQETLAEIVDFVYFVRKRTLEPQAFQEDRKPGPFYESLPLNLGDLLARHAPQLIRSGCRG